MRNVQVFFCMGKVIIGKYKNEKGQMLALAAVMIGALAVMFSFSLNVGQIVSDKSVLQAAADAGALAGGAKMGDYSTQAEAEPVAKAFTLKNLDNHGEVTVRANLDTGRVEVTASREVEIFGGMADNVTVSARSVAEVKAAGDIKYAPPFVIQEPKNMQWTGHGGKTTQTYTMQKNADSNDYTTFTYVDTVFKKPTKQQDYLNLLRYGYQEQCNLDTTLYYVAQATASATAVQYFGQRVLDDPNTDVTKAKYGDQRLLIIPLVEHMPQYSASQDWSYRTDNLKITGFIGFWVESIDYGDGYGDKPYKEETQYYWDPWYGRVSRTYRSYPDYYPNFKVKGQFVKVTLPRTSGVHSNYNNKYFGTSQVTLVE